MNLILLIPACGLSILLCGCAPGADGEAAGVPATAANEPTNSPPEAAMKLSGPFADHAVVDRQYTGEGADISPPLSWTGAPAETRSFVLICDDPDAPSPKHPGPEPWVHWVMYNIPPAVTALPEKIARTAEPAEVPGARQGKNSWPSDHVGYRGPLPPPGSGRHRYFFRVYALDCELTVPAAGATRAAIATAMRGHILAEGQLVGTYERK